MNLIAGIDADNRCYIGQERRDEEWLLEHVTKVIHYAGDKLYGLTAKDIVDVYLQGDPVSLVFIYAENDVEKFFQAEVANKKLLDAYMQNT